MSLTLIPGGSGYYDCGCSCDYGCRCVYDYNYIYEGSYSYGYWPVGYVYATGGCGGGGASLSCGGASLSKGNFRTQDHGISVRRKSTGYMMVSWTKPKSGCFKLNTDGASKGNPGASSCGGIIRDSDGKWFSGFHRKIGFASSIEAELWALRDGLILAMSKGLGRDKLEVEVDATQVLELIDDSDNHHDDLQLQDLVSQCRWLLKQFGLTTPKHIYRETNQCADVLANYNVGNKGTTQDGWPDFKSAPTCVEDKMLADASGALYRRTLYE